MRYDERLSIIALKVSVVAPRVSSIDGQMRPLVWVSIQHSLPYV